MAQLVSKAENPEGVSLRENNNEGVEAPSFGTEMQKLRLRLSLVGPKGARYRPDGIGIKDTKRKLHERKRRAEQVEIRSRGK